MTADITYTHTHHLLCQGTNDLADVNGEGTALMKAANDANHCADALVTSHRVTS